MSAAAKARVVFDTNVVVSALLFTGRFSWLVGHWSGGNCIPLISRESAKELTRVLAYSKFNLTSDEQLEALGSYLPFCDVVEIILRCPAICRDAKDQGLLDLAQCGKADLLVTGDGDLLAQVGQTQFTIEHPERYRSRIFEANRG
jgi:putative PIN family toxin of toxin-antitoxin system